MDSAVGLTGCHALGIEREPCEHDVVIIGREPQPPTSIRAGDTYMDLYFLTEEQASSHVQPEVAVSLASVKPVKDTSLVLSAATSAARETLDEISKRCAEDRLTAAVKALGRADEALSKDELRDADFWLLSAGYDFAYAWLYSTAGTPAPSHVLAQLRERSRGKSRMYEAFSKAVGLEGASRASCTARLEALSVIFDLREGPPPEADASGPPRLRLNYEILRRKSTFLVGEMQPVDCYSFLGFEVARNLPEILKSRPTLEQGLELNDTVVSSLSGGKDRLIGEGVMRSLGIQRKERAIKEGLVAVRDQISALSRKT